MSNMTTSVGDFSINEFSSNGISHRVYLKGVGPDVLLMHELPGMTPQFINLARTVADAGFTVHLPLFFGEPGQELAATSGSMARIFGLGNDALSGFVGVVSFRCRVLPSCRRGSTVEPSQPGEVVSKIGQADLDAGADQANGAHNQADPAFLGGADHRPSPASPISAAGDSSQKQSAFSGFQLGRFEISGCWDFQIWWFE
jgi:hypothetical protein